MPDVTSIHWSPGSPADQLAGQGAVMRLLPIKAGHVAAKHHHNFEQFLFVVSGGGRLECERGGIALEPGTALHLEAGAWHSAEFTADTVLMELNLGQA